MRVTDENNVVRVRLTPDEYLEVANGFYGEQSPNEVEFEDESGAKSVVFILDVPDE